MMESLPNPKYVVVTPEEYTMLEALFYDKDFNAINELLKDTPRIEYDDLTSHTTLPADALMYGSQDLIIIRRSNGPN